MPSLLAAHVYSSGRQSHYPVCSFSLSFCLFAGPEPSHGQLASICYLVLGEQLANSLLSMLMHGLPCRHLRASRLNIIYPTGTSWPCTNDGGLGHAVSGFGRVQRLLTSCGPHSADPLCVNRPHSTLRRGPGALSLRASGVQSTRSPEPGRRIRK